MSSPQVKAVYESQDCVGESLVWDERSGSLFWVDIVGKRIHRLQLETGKHAQWATPDFVTAIGLREDGGLIVSLTKSICLWDFDNNFEPFATIEPELPGNRINECVVAPDGSYWVGTMQNNIAPDGSPQAMDANTGAYYRVDSSGKVTQLTDASFGITNTMAWTADGRFLTADTLANELYAYAYDDVSKTLGARSVFASGPDRGVPDGSCLDAEGYLWNCRVAGGACLARLAPDGSLDRIVELPCSSPTSCTFGGPDLRTLYVTSARFAMSPEHLITHPHEGNLWALDVGVAGRLENRFG